jgi:hypothetical protein
MVKYEDIAGYEVKMRLNMKILLEQYHEFMVGKRQLISAIYKFSAREGESYTPERILHSEANFIHVV